MDQADNSLISKLNKIGMALSSEHNLTRLLEMIVKEIKENQHAVRQLIDGQNKENGKDLNSKIQDKKDDI